MSIAHVFLGLLEPGASHGYTLKREYDARFARARPLKFGQVYATLQRLERDGLAAIIGTESGAGPDRKVYEITPAGVEGLEQWLASPEPATVHAQSVLFVKVTLALMTGRPAGQIIDAQRKIHLARMRELTAARRNADVMEQVAADYEIAHLDADLSWIETAAVRLESWAAELTKEPAR